MEKIGEYGTLSANLAIMYGAPQCCLQAFQQKIASVSIKEWKDGVVIATGYVNTIKDNLKVCIFDAILQIRRNGETIKQVNYTAGDNYREGIIAYYEPTEDAEAEYTLWVGGAPGSSASCAAMSGAGFLVEAR